MQAQEYAVTRFFNDTINTSTVWLQHLNTYQSIPNKVKDAEKFKILDYWYHAFDVSRGYITKAELIQIMKWKLTRGKMRPLLSKIEALDDEVVQKATQDGINCIRHVVNDSTIKSALESISKPLKGAGPATASAILAKWNTAIPLMSDAGLLAVNRCTDYKISDYLRYYHGITAKVNQLNTDGTNQHRWTAKEVEAVLHLVYSRFDLNLSIQ